MSFTYNKPELKKRRRSLRQQQTDVEYKIWQKLRARQLNGYKFFRQYSVGNFILDFFCPQKRIALELDGGQHNDPSNQTHDLKRTKFLNAQGIKVLRIWNHDVIENLDGVLEYLLNELEKY